MLSAFVFTLLSLFLHRFPVAAPPPRHEDPPWFVGCVTTSGLRVTRGARDLDPVSCCVRCLDRGFQVAVLNSETCYCGNRQLGVRTSDCFNTSSNGEGQDRGGGRRVLHLPVGGGWGTAALYTTKGPFLHNVRLSTSPHRVHAGKSFVVEVSGSLAAGPSRPTGILGLGGRDFSYVTVEFQGTTPKGQSSCHVNVLDDGSFVVSSDWILETPGTHELTVSVSNPLSSLSSTLHVSVLQPSPHSLVVSVIHGLLGVPSCSPFPHTDSKNVSVEAAYLGDPVTLQADVGGGPAVEFLWSITHRGLEETVEVRTACVPDSDCVNDAVKWTFNTEGVHTVSVNASSDYGWTQTTIQIVVVPLVVSDLRVRVSGNPVISREDFTVDVEVFTTIKHLLVLNLTLSQEHGSIDTKDNDNKDISDSIEITHQESSNRHDCNRSNHGNISYDYSLSPNHHNIYCQGFTHSSDTQQFVALRLLHTTNGSSCHLRLHLHCLLPPAAGRFLLMASLLSTSNTSSVLLPVLQPQALTVYERICALWPSGGWKSAVSTHTEFSLEVVSHVSTTGSRVIWAFSLDDLTVTSRTTEEWSLTVSFPKAGCYKATVKAFNPVSWASFSTLILIQDPVGELVLNVPSVVRINRKHCVSFSVTAGSNVSVSLLVNATVVYSNSSYAAGDEAMVVLLLNHTGTVVVELHAENRVSSQNKSVNVSIEGNRKPSPQVTVNPAWQSPVSHSPVHNQPDNVWIYAEKQVYPTNTDITFLAVSDVPDPVDFFWDFGDSRSDRTSSRTVTKKYHKPGRYDVVVVMSSEQTSVTSDVFPLIIQRAVQLNRLLHHTSVLQSQTLTVSCRVNVGTDVSFLWTFGDGSSRLGQSTEQHVFNRTGEFKVEVTVSNLVSSASLSAHIFVVDRPCRPPPVKNMGPLKVQVHRSEVLRLGVTFETEVDCDISGGLRYTWTLFDSAGQIFPLPLVDTHRQTLILPRLLLHYDTYTAIARVQVPGSVVYSNYSVKVQVKPSAPVASIQGGTNVFINNRNMTVVTLDGQRSFDQDFPMNPLSFRWTCKPVSSIPSSCFHHDIPTSSPVLVFPASFLKHNFDQFQFSLTVHSGERSASSEIFLTLTPDVTGKVSVSCPQCQGEQVNGHQSFSVIALCEDCDISPEYFQYTWSLYLVNASSKPVREVPFCSTVDLSTPSTIMDGAVSPPLGTAVLYPPATDESQHIQDVRTSAPVSLIESVSETRAKHFNMPDSRTISNNTKESTMSGLTEPDPSSVSSLAGSGEEPFYRPRGGFDPPKLLYSSSEYPPLAFDSSGVLFSGYFGQSDVISEFPPDSNSSADWEFSFPVLESGDLGGERADSTTDPDYDPSIDAEEGDPGISAGRPTDVDGESLSSGDDLVFDPALHEDEGSNLVDSRPAVVIQEPILLDLPRDLVDRGLFESFTYTGISSAWLSFRPFSLTPGSRYMLEVTAKSRNRFLGRTQLFLKTRRAPSGVMCQVQPVRGMELYTHFSIFCTSGKEDLLYEYSISVGHGRPRTLYEGRDFQHYFSLPAGDPSDDYKVTIYTEIRSGTYGTPTKPCPVTVQVQPSFVRDDFSPHHDPDLELSESGLRNLSALVWLGNSAEVRNYVSLLSNILNRLSVDANANTHAQRSTRSVLIRTLCELESLGQVSMMDNICILRTLLEVTSQVTLGSVRHVMAHVKVISEQFVGSSAPALFSLEQDTLHTLVAVLSYSLQAVMNAMSTSADITQRLDSDPHDEMQGSPSGIHMEQGLSISAKQAVQLVTDILQTASDLMLKYMLFHEAYEHRVDAGLVSLFAAYLNQTSTVLSSDSTTVYMPDSLIQRLSVHRSKETDTQCVFTVLTELNHNPYTWAHYPGRLSGPAVDFSLYKCSTRTKIPVRSLVQPINIELQRPPRNKSHVLEYVLLRSQINYHTFNITQEHLQQAIQLSVVFTPPLSKAFPIMLLFRMFEKPTPSMHHLQRIHYWESNITRFTLPTSYLSAAGVGHLALLNADFGRTLSHKHLSEQVSYSLTVDSSLCLSWDGHLESWTHRGCRTQQADTTSAVNCSCHRLRPLTVVKQQIQSSHETTNLDPFLSVSSDVTVLVVLVLCVCLYIPGLVVCKRADLVCEENHRVHFLTDNSPHDAYLYAVTIHTGLCSAACMSAKVYIVLNGEDGFSQTKELQVPGCTLFRRNSQDTFILSAADNLGSVWGVHIWHDNSGSSPTWFLKQVQVSEVSRGPVSGRTWLFVGQCWLAVNKADGRVERKLHATAHGVGFAKMFGLMLSDYMADYHIWMSVYSCPCPHSFTRTQRLGVSLLLLLGYACVNTVIISEIDNQLPLELGLIDPSADSVMTGLLSVAAALPTAAIISFLFRLRILKHSKCTKTEKDLYKDAPSVNGSIFEPQISWNNFQDWAQEAWRKKYQGTDLLSVSTPILESKNSDKEPVMQADVVIRKKDTFTVENNMGPSPLNVLLITERNNFDQGPPGKELDLLIENRMLHGAQRAVLSCVTGGKTIQEEQDPQGKYSSDFDKGGHRLAARPGHSSGYCLVDRLRGFRSVSHCLAWTLCLLLSISCLVLSAVLGMRFSSSKVLLWIHSLFFSLVSCIFVIQPAVIIAVAMTVSYWRRKRSDFQSFFSLRDIERETTELWSYNDADQSEEQSATSAFPQENSANLEKLLGARQRARYLRLVRPPSPAELRKSCGKKRKETFLYHTLRDLSVCGSLLLLMLCINYGNSFTDHFQLNKAVRKQFTGGHNDAFMSIQKQEHWWKWIQISLLSSLYKNTSATTESHILIGEPILWKLEVSNSFQAQALVPMATPPRTCGHLGCYLGSGAPVGLGHTRSDAASKLKLLRSGSWLGRQTVSVHFTLFTPAPNLFTSVTLILEQSPSGVLLPSVKVQSVRTHHTPMVWDYVVMVFQLLSLLLSLLHLCDQVCAMGQQGLMGYWRTPCNWLEVSLLTVSLVYYFYYIHHSVMVLEVVELLQRHNYREHVDVSLLATWEQCVRTLRGVTLFLLTMKCVTVLRLNRTMATSAALLTQSLSSLFWPTMVRVILVVALACVGNLWFAESSLAFSSLSCSLQTLLCHCWSLSVRSSLVLSGRHCLYQGVLYLSYVVGTAVAVGVMSSLVRDAKKSPGRGNVFTIAELAGYIRQRVSEVTGQRRHEWTENHMEGRKYYFEEFESLVDELLFRLNTLSNSLNYTLPLKAHHYRQEDRPVLLPIETLPNMETEEMKMMMKNDHIDVGGRRGTLPVFQQLRSRLELEILQRGQRGGHSPSDDAVTSDTSQQSGTRAKENPTDRQTYSKEPKYPSLPESGAAIRVWTEDDLENLDDRWTETSDTRCMNKTQATHTEVVVEVLIHKEPGTVEPDKE